MKITKLLLLSTAAIVLSGHAFAVEKETYESNTKIEKDSTGNYSEKYSATKKDADGTTTASVRELKIDADEKGNKEKMLTTKKTIDPKGLGNKHIESTKDTLSSKDGKVSVSHEKIVNGKTVEGSHDNYKNESSSESDAKGNFVQKDITTNTDSNGTVTQFEKRSNIDVDANGDASKVVTTKEVTDPKGLNNMRTTTTTNSESAQDGKFSSGHEVKVDGKTIESETDVTTKK